MKILMVGGGGREHVLIRKIRENPRVETVYALPGNGGIAGEAICVPIAATDIEKIVAFAVEQAIDFAVVAPDDPLVLGAADALRAAGIKTFGPSRAAAAIEGSKAFAKGLMRKYSIPTAEWAVFEDQASALAYAHKQQLPLVIKADGLALGKGVVIAEDWETVEQTIGEMLSGRAFGESGRRIVIEECLTGPEVTVLAFTDGKTLIPMVSSMDHKRALDGDKGLNTGGMGVIAPNPFYTDEIAARCYDEIFLPTMNAMNAEGRPFKGCLYFGLMLTPNGAKVIEYNCRFGDPEAQTVLSLLQSDLLTIFEAVEAEALTADMVRFAPGAACCVMVVSGGYPGNYQKGLPVALAGCPEGVSFFHSGTGIQGDQLVTSGGRVLGVVAVGDELQEAIKLAYQTAPGVRFDGAFYRQDIGQKALEANK
ncbi:MAG: phosphoribosylamine--glycine ligase [Oscillospiraceae bacterium]|jgi:phosphoribosylamine--glycine ligase|nr:phosphoribosylamine--glycine ligase [Oscillospiraceae bacterium]